jgi:outer membrane protein OmpA-like peptidoglycan-associated protein
MKKFLRLAIITVLFAIPVFIAQNCLAQAGVVDRDESRKKENEALQQKFNWWPTDARPGPVEDKDKGGYWWWPTTPGTVKHLWGNRGYCYVRKIIFDYKEEELPPPQPQEMRPSLLVRNIIKNVKIYFDYDKSDIRNDSVPILDDAVKALGKNPKADILLTGNCDIRGSEQYNDKLGKRRGEAVKKYMLDKGVAEERIRTISRGKLDAIAHVTDLVGMQKDRNAQFMVAEVEEVMLPYTGQAPSPEAKQVEEGKYIEEKKEEVTGEVKVSTRDYIIKPGDSLWKIAQKEMGSGYRWKYLYEMNKDVIKDPKKLKAGKKIVIPVE